MNIIQLKYFIAVAVSGSFSDAAEIMFSTQSTVSKQILSLEKDLNTKLFDRSKRKISLTEHGKSVLKHSQIIIDDYNNMLKELADLDSYDDNTIRIASTPVMVPYNILTLLANFRKNFPYIKMNVEEQENNNLFNHLRDGNCDVAFIRSNSFDEEIFEKTIIYTDRIAVCMSQNHPLAARDSVSLKELSKENFLLLDKGTELYNKCIEACNKCGFSPTVIYTGNRMTNIFEMVGKDMGVGLMLHKAGATTFSDLCGEGTALVPLKETILSHVALVRMRRRHCNSATNSLWEYINKNTNQ